MVNIYWEEVHVNILQATFDLKNKKNNLIGGFYDSK